MMRDLNTVPATPLYALMIRPGEKFGLALTIDGEEIATASDVKKLREIGLTELRVLAALAGRPVRARAVEPDFPTPWNMTAAGHEQPLGRVTPARVPGVSVACGMMRET
ncbi:hypothetical protein ACFWB1_34500 [Streptomyces goshikiensis]